MKDLSHIHYVVQEHSSILHRLGCRPSAGSQPGQAPGHPTRIAGRDARLDQIGHVV